MIKMIFGVTDDLSLMPEFLKWYDDRGVEEFLINIIHPNSDKQLPLIKEIAKDYNYRICFCLNDTHHTSLQHVQRVDTQRKYTAIEDWVLFADLDEFHEYPKNIHSFLKSFNCKQGIITGLFIDRFAPNNELIKYNSKKSLFDQYPIESDVSLSVAKVPGHRIVAVKGFIHEGSSHISKNPKALLLQKNGVKVVYSDVKIHHFKWRSGVLERLSRRIDHYNEIGVLKAERKESSKILKYFGREK